MQAFGGQGALLPRGVLGVAPARASGKKRVHKQRLKCLTTVGQRQWLGLLQRI